MQREKGEYRPEITCALRDPLRQYLRPEAVTPSDTVPVPQMPSYLICPKFYTREIRL